MVRVKGEHTLVLRYSRRRGVNTSTVQQTRALHRLRQKKMAFSHHRAPRMYDLTWEPPRLPVRVRHVCEHRVITTQTLGECVQLSRTASHRQCNGISKKTQKFYYCNLPKSKLLTQILKQFTACPAHPLPRGAPAKKKSCPYHALRSKLAVRCTLLRGVGEEFPWGSPIKLGQRKYPFISFDSLLQRWTEHVFGLN